MSEPPSPAVVDAAIDWYVRLAEGQSSDEERAAFSRWHDADATHAEAWRRLQSLGDRVARSGGLVETPLVHRVLDAAIEAAPRRRLLKALIWAGVSGGGVWLLRDPLALPQRWDGLVADVSTPVGGRRDLRLPDGSRLRLNTDSAVDVRFDRTRRLLIVRHGEIEVTTASDTTARRFVVETAEGRLLPLGTRFGVRSIPEQGTLLTVSEGMVEAWPAMGGRAVRVAAGHQVRFDRSGADQIMPLDPQAVAWTLGLIVACRTRLEDFVAELTRYRIGWIRCDPAVAELRLTATHPLDGPDSIDAVLRSLPQALPVRLNRLTRYWTTIGPR